MTRTELLAVWRKVGRIAAGDPDYDDTYGTITEHPDDVDHGCGPMTLFQCGDCDDAKGLAEDIAQVWNAIPDMLKEDR